MEKLLIVDDEEIELDGMAELIDWPSYGYELVGTAINGKRGLALIQEKQPDIVITDIKMPVMDGLEASKKIRELPEGKGKDIPIIAMTANAFVEDKEKTKEAGMNAHLTKPVNREEIIRVLAAYWKNKG